jgi:hypothetical protein
VARDRAPFTGSLREERWRSTRYLEAALDARMGGILAADWWSRRCTWCRACACARWWWSGLFLLNQWRRERIEQFTRHGADGPRRSTGADIVLGDLQSLSDMKAVRPGGVLASGS